MRIYGRSVVMKYLYISAVTERVNVFLTFVTDPLFAEQRRLQSGCNREMGTNAMTIF
jgi:hypothetical protein